MTDTERLDAIGVHGLCISTHDTLMHDGWERVWVCQYGDEKLVLSPTIRGAIDAAMLDLETPKIKH